MVAPLLALPLLMAGVAAGGAGRTMLSDYLARRQTEEDQAAQQARYQQALGAATTVQEAPRADPGMVGPMPGQEQIDPSILAQQLIAQGDPRGMEMLESLQGQAATAEQNALNRQAAWDRALLSSETSLARGAMGNQPLPTMNVPGVGEVPYEPIVPGAGPVGKQWSELQIEGRDLSRLGQIQQEFARALQEGGTEVFDTRLAGLRNEAVDILARQSGAGALQQADIDFYTEAIGDPTSWTPEWLKRNRGRLDALRDRVNNAIRSHNARARFAVGLSPLPELQSSGQRAAGALPQGARYLSDAELDASIAAQQRQLPDLEGGMGLDMTAREAMRRELEGRE